MADQPPIIPGAVTLANVSRLLLPPVTPTPPPPPVEAADTAH